MRSMRISAFATLLALIVPMYGACFTAAVSAAESRSESIVTCFVPGENCTQFIVDVIDAAKSEILVQAYNYTSPPILAALARAKEKRGVVVRVILDKVNEQERYTGGTFMLNHGIPVLTDQKVAIAHNKVIIIDRRHVITGSFNFTVAAQKRNAENVVLIRDNPAVAARFIQNWERRAVASRPFEDRRSRSK